jgi:general secretion pathway protein I
MTHRRGFTLLEMIVATTIMGIAVAGLMSGLAASTRNAIRLRDYDRAVQLARLQMNTLMADPKPNPGGAGTFDRELTGGLECGWQARIAVAGRPREGAGGGEYVVDRIDLELWWVSAGQRRTLPVQTFRRRLLRGDEPEGLR